MRTTLVRLFCSLTLLLLAAPAANSAGDCWVYGRVSYGDGSACRNCCPVMALLSLPAMIFQLLQECLRGGLDSQR